MQKTKLSPESPLPTLLCLHLDEAGRGPLAGPVSVGCILALKKIKRGGFQDSKTLSEKTRESLYTKLESFEAAGSLTFHSGFASNKDIDQRGIMYSLQKASIRAIFFTLRKYFYSQWKEALSTSVYEDNLIALTQLKKLFSHKSPSKKILAQILNTPNSVAKIETIIIDGNHSFGLDTALNIDVVTIIKGDSKNALISMASIVAKVERDHFMKVIDKKLPAYDFAIHKGYGTQKHRESIASEGISSFHRATFCGNITLKRKKKGEAKKQKKNIRLIPRVNHDLVINAQNKPG